MPGTATLGDLVSGLGFELVRVVVAPRGLDVGIGDPIIHDSLTGTRLAAGDVVLAVGLDPAGPAMLDLVREAASCSAAALIAKFDDEVPGPVQDEALACGVALLRATRDVEWGQLHALARMVTSTAGTRDETDPLLGDLFALANAIAARTGGPVTIEDGQSRVLAYSTGSETIDDFRRDTILGRRVPEEWIRRLQDDGAFRRIWLSDTPVRISYSASEPAYRDRLVMAVRAGSEVVGSIWVQEGDRPLDEVTERTLVEVAPLAALHLVRHFAGDVERRQESELLGAVLTGRAPTGSIATLLTHRRGHVVSVLGVRAIARRASGVGDAPVARGERRVPLPPHGESADRLHRQRRHDVRRDHRTRGPHRCRREGVARASAHVGPDAVGRCLGALGRRSRRARRCSP